MQFDALGCCWQRHGAPDLRTSDITAATANRVAERDTIAISIPGTTTQTDGAWPATARIGRAAPFKRTGGEFADAHLLRLPVPVEVGGETSAVLLLKRNTGALPAHRLAGAGRAGLKTPRLPVHIGDTQGTRLAGICCGSITTVAHLRRNLDGLTASRRRAVPNHGVGLEAACEARRRDKQRQVSAKQPMATNAQGRYFHR